MKAKLTKLDGRVSLAEQETWLVANEPRISHKVRHYGVDQHKNMALRVF